MINLVASEEVSEGLISMVKMMADAPENQRRSVLEIRLKEFAVMPDEQRKEAMTQMIKAVNTLQPEQIQSLAKTRIESLVDSFEEADRKKLMDTHMKSLIGLPHETMKSDMGAMFAVMPRLGEGHRNVVMNTMKELMMAMPEEQRNMMMSMLPEDARKMLGM